VWPESTYTGNNPELHIEGEPALLGEAPSDLDPAQYLRNLTRSEQFFRQRTESLARAINAPYAPTDGDRHIAMIAGTSSHFLRTDSTETYNSALLIQPDGKITDRYYKMHRVLIGEYTPGAEQFEWIQRLTPVEGIRAGTQAKRFEVGGIALMPNICFESTVPQLVRGQLAEAAKGGRVDAIVNMTHDGWFWGSSILDLHMACGVFRAVENRISFLAAANPGITYACDGSGRIQESLTREEKGYLVADVKPDGRRSLYQFWSDWPFGVCAALCLGIGLVGLFPRRATEPVG
jgi:apolipoprotein N-acyltransferase